MPAVRCRGMAAVHARGESSARRRRRHPDLPMRPANPVKRELEHLRHGTLCPMGAYDVRRHKLFGFVSEDHDSQTFVD